MIKTVLLVPLRDNSGRRIPRTTWRELHRRLLQFGGLSRSSGIVGYWEHRGHVYQDISRQYTVSLASWTQLPAWLEVAQWAREQFRQEAIYIEIAGVPEILTGQGGSPVGGSTGS